MALARNREYISRQRVSTYSVIDFYVPELIDLQVGCARKKHVLIFKKYLVITIDPPIGTKDMTFRVSILSSNADSESAKKENCSLTLKLKP